MPLNQLDRPRRRGKRKDRPKRERRTKRRKRRRKRTSKWSSVPPDCKTHRSHHREGHLDHSAREPLLRTGGTLPISRLVLLGVERG
uniref:Uncharacterized protein n=1 Tax=Oryza punctata TaxID=4537 RepID=A0A0E0MDA7_ORYPU